MAVLYANSITGNDSNNGSSWALAKKTLNGAYGALTSGDTVYCHGIFSDTISTTGNKTVYWTGVGLFEYNGAGLNSMGGSLGITWYWIGATFRDWINTVFGGSTHHCLGCVFRNNVNVFAAGAPSCILTDNAFLNNSGTCITNSNTTSQWNITNCLFAGNAVDLDMTGANAGNVFNVYNSVFRSAIMVRKLTTGGQIFNGFYNVYDFSFGKCVANGVDKTTLTDWKAATGVTAPNDTDRAWATDVGDLTNGLDRSRPGGYLLTAGPMSGIIGRKSPAVSLSNNVNSALWTGGVFSNTEIDGSGYLVLSAGQTLGTWASDVIDFGASINAKKLEILQAGETVSTYIDYDTADSPGYYNYEIRGSNTTFLKTAVSPSWVVVPRNAEIGAYMSNTLRYWQVRLTLRG